MDLGTKPLSALISKIFTRNRVPSEGYFHLGIVNNAGHAVLTRTNSLVAKRIRVKSYSDLKFASLGKRLRLANNQSANVSIVYNEHIYGNPTIKITWIQGCRRYETDLLVQSIGIY